MVVLGLSVLDDGRHRHHRFLLLHHLARLPARSTFTRHREPIYFADLFTGTLARARTPHTTTATATPRWRRHHPGSARPFRFFFQTVPSPRPRRVISRKKRSCLSPTSFVLALPRPNSNTPFPFGIDLVWLHTALLWRSVRDRPRGTDCLIILRQKVKSVVAVFREQEGI